MSYGYSDPKWMLKQLILQSDPRYLKHAVVTIIDTMHERDVTSFEVMEMLAQLSATGKYEPVNYVANFAEEAIRVADELLNKYGASNPVKSQEEIDAEVAKFRDFLGGLGGQEDHEEEGE